MESIGRAPDPADASKTNTIDQVPETAVKDEWKNVRTIQIASSPGTQTFVDLTVTRDGCTATYGAAILVPQVSCGNEKGGVLVADQKLCDPNPNDESLFGSGISQGVPTRCEDISSDPANPRRRIHEPKLCMRPHEDSALARSPQPSPLSSHLV
jgi:hypothetical protein